MLYRTAGKYTASNFIVDAEFAKMSLKLFKQLHYIITYEHTEFFSVKNSGMDIIRADNNMVGLRYNNGGTMVVLSAGFSCFYVVILQSCLIIFGKDKSECFEKIGNYPDSFGSLVSNSIADSLLPYE